MDALRFKGLVRGSTVGACPKRLAYMSDSVTERVDNGQASENPRFDDGHWHEFDVKRRIGEAGGMFEGGVSRVHNAEVRIHDEWAVRCHWDGVIHVNTDRDLPAWLPSGRFLIEVKSMATGSFWKFVKDGYRRAFPGYFDQVQAYLNSSFTKFTPMSEERTPVRDLYHGLWAYEFTEYELALLPRSTPVYALILAKNKETGRIWSEVVERDDTHWDGIIRRWRVAEAAVVRGELPDRLYDNDKNFECRECPWRETCWQDHEGREVAVTELTTIDAIEASQLLTLGRAFEQAGERMVEQAAAVLTPEAPGKYVVGDVKINKFPVDKVTWDYNRIEELLTAEQLREVKTVTPGYRVMRTAPKIDGAKVKELIQGLSNNPALLTGGS